MKREWLILLMLAGCVSPMQMEPDALRELAPDEGRVIGSILVVAAEVGEDESSLAFLEGGESAGYSYEFTIRQMSEWLIDLRFSPPRYRMSVEAGVEEAFALNLPAGEYRFVHVEQDSFLPTALELKAKVSVVAGQTTYIGRLSVELPTRGGLKSGALYLDIEDRRKEAAALLGVDYREFVLGARTGLIERYY